MKLLISALCFIIAGLCLVELALAEVVATFDETTAQHFRVGVILGAGVNTFVNSVKDNPTPFERYGLSVASGAFAGVAGEAFDEDFDVIDLTATITGAFIGAYISDGVWLSLSEDSVMVTGRW